MAASEFSKINKFHGNPSPSIKKASINIDKLIKKGSENIFELENDLYNVMWKYCGVIKNEGNLKIGLKEIHRLNTKIMNVDISSLGKLSDGLINLLNLKASILCAKTTIISALERKESRGAHQRSDFNETNYKNDFNYIIYLENNKEIVLKKYYYQKIDKNLKKIVDSTRKITNFDRRLLE